MDYTSKCSWMLTTIAQSIHLLACIYVGIWGYRSISVLFCMLVKGQVYTHTLHYLDTLLIRIHSIIWLMIFSFSCQNCQWNGLPWAPTHRVSSLFSSGIGKNTVCSHCMGSNPSKQMSEPYKTWELWIGEIYPNSSYHGSHHENHLENNHLLAGIIFLPHASFMSS